MSATTAPSNPPTGGTRNHGVVRRANGLPWILPAIVLSVGLIYYCIGYTLYISTLDWNGVSPRPDSVGLGNYIRIFSDSVFWMTMQHTAVFYVVTFTIQTIIGFTFAVLLHSRVLFATFYKVLVFLPVVMAPAITAPVFRRIFAPDGAINAMLDLVGLDALAQPWIGQPSTAMPVIMLVTIWHWTGVTFVLYFAGISQIDASLLEAARIDGASNFRVVRSIIWPQLRGTTVALAILGAIGALKTFDIPWLVTVAGPNSATEFLGTYIYRMAIPQAHVGYAAGLSIILLVIAVLLALIINSGGRGTRSQIDA